LGCPTTDLEIKQPKSALRRSLIREEYLESMKKALTKERVKLPGFCPTNETVDFILKYASKDGSHDSGYSISARGDTK
jgi:hypothetical protein